MRLIKFTNDNNGQTGIVVDTDRKTGKKEGRAKIVMLPDGRIKGLIFGALVAIDEKWERQLLGFEKEYELAKDLSEFIPRLLKAKWFHGIDTYTTHGNPLCVAHKLDDSLYDVLGVKLRIDGSHGCWRLIHHKANTVLLEEYRHDWLFSEIGVVAVYE